MLKEYDIKCTSYMVGQALLQNPQVGEWMVKEGHEVARYVSPRSQSDGISDGNSHGWRWVDRSGWTPEEVVENVKKAINGEQISQIAAHELAIRDITGKPPVGWYYGMVQSKAGVRSRALVAKTFAEEGLPLKYYSDDYSDDLPHWIERPHAPGEGLLLVPYA
jgi:peptidoglycan/xylan/chitin deacetylase (PgdA/CDA1 family)